MSQAVPVRHGNDGRPRPTLLLICPGPVTDIRPVPEPEIAGPVIACPLCGHAVPYPIMVRDGSLSLAECIACDVYFEAEPVNRHSQEATR
jgi:hypothetical protein